MEARAVAKYVRMSPIKLQPVCDLVRGKDLNDALAILKFTPNHAAADVAKVVKSAAANAVHNNGLQEEALYVKACYADEGMTLKRWMPRAKGRAAQILKRTSHITVVVSDER